MARIDYIRERIKLDEHQKVYYEFNQLKLLIKLLLYNSDNGNSWLWGYLPSDRNRKDRVYWIDVRFLRCIRLHYEQNRQHSESIRINKRGQKQKVVHHQQLHEQQVSGEEFTERSPRIPGIHLDGEGDKRRRRREVFIFSAVRDLEAAFIPRSEQTSFTKG
jgi:hypothetical protein